MLILGSVATRRPSLVNQDRRDQVRDPSRNHRSVSGVEPFLDPHSCLGQIGEQPVLAKNRGLLLIFLDRGDKLTALIDTISCRPLCLLADRPWTRFDSERATDKTKQQENEEKNRDRWISKGYRFIHASFLYCLGVTPTTCLKALRKIVHIFKTNLIGDLINLKSVVRSKRRVVSWWGIWKGVPLFSWSIHLDTRDWNQVDRPNPSG